MDVSSLNSIMGLAGIGPFCASSYIFGNTSAWTAPWIINPKNKARILFAELAFKSLIVMRLLLFAAVEMQQRFWVSCCESESWVPVAILEIVEVGVALPGW